ncbi:MAG: YMGG-like glycine zipper-containing protein [Accumulibacter sp.]
MSAIALDPRYAGCRACPSRVGESKTGSAPGLTTITPAIMHCCRCAPLLSALLLGACVSLPPEGPAVMALPGSGRTFEQFRIDDQLCRAYAGRSIGPQTPEGAAADSAVGSAVLGTAIGAAVGAAIDGSSGAAVGAGVGLLAGSVTGAAAANASAYELQRRYDQSYVQCMYGRGHRVPVVGGYPLRPGAGGPPAVALPPPPPPPRGAPPPPPAAAAPLPPRGAPPAPPPAR